MRSLLFYTLIALSALGCADKHQHSYATPLPMEDPTAYSVTYLVKSDFNEIKETSRKILGSRYELYKQKEGKTGYNTPYWNLKGKDVEYKKGIFSWMSR